MEKRHEEAPLLREREEQLWNTSYSETDQRRSTGRKGSTMEGRERETRRNRLYQASLSGNVDTLNELMKEDPLTLARACITCFDETPLHIAAMLGHVDFAAALVCHKPDLVTKSDSRGHSPLHLASANGYVEIVNKLLLVNTDVCLTPDEDGRTPLHLAVMHGQDQIINELVRARPEAILHEFNRGETLLHSCVEHNRLKALKLLVETGRVDDFINVKDHDGNTILHMATSLMRLEMIKYLLSRPRVELNEVNANGFTALDIIEHMPRVLKSVKIHEALQRAGAFKAANIPALAHDSQRTTRESEISPVVVVNLEAVAPPSHPQRVAVAQPPMRRGSIKEHLKEHEDWLEKKRDALLIAATVIAGMAYQAGLNPPGGVWQQDSDFTLDNQTKPAYYAGESVIAYTRSFCFQRFWLYNTVSFVSSLSIIFLLLSGIPLKRRFFMWILMLTTWVTITFMALTYWTSVIAISPLSEEYKTAYVDKKKQKTAFVFAVISRSYLVWLGLVGVVFLVHIVRFLIWSVRKVYKLGKWLLGTRDQGNV